MNLRLTIETALLDFIYEKQEWLITSVVHHKTNIFPTHFKQMNKEHCKRHIQYYIQYPTKWYSKFKSISFMNSIYIKYNCIHFVSGNLPTNLKTQSPSSSTISWDVKPFLHRSLAWHGQSSVQERLCSKQIQPLLQTDFPLQVQIRSCKKSEDIMPKKRTGSGSLIPFCQP